MKDKDKAQGQLMEELKHLRQRVAELESADANRKQMEEALHLQEKRFQAIAENSSDVIILLDAKGTVLYESPAMEQLLGLNPRDRVGASVFERIYPEDRPAVTELFQRLLQNSDAPVQRVELRLRHKDGSWRTVDAAGSAIMHDSVVEGLVVNLRDITDRKKAEEDLRKSEERFQALIEASLDVTVVIDVQGNVIYLSPNFENVWGRKAAGILGRDMFKDIHPEDIPLIGSGFVRLLKNPKEPMQLQIRATRIDGALCILDAVAHNRLEDPAVRGIVVNFRDVTELKRAEEVLRESEDKYKCLIGNIPEIIFTIDLEGKLTFVSQKTKEILGYESAETINMNILNFVPEEDRQRAIENLQKGMAGEKIAHFQTPLIKKSGERLIFECSFSRVYKDGAVVGAQGTAVDITDRKRAEEVLRESEERYRMLVENVSDALWNMDMNLNLTYHSGGARIFGYTVEEMLKRPVDQRMTPESIQTAFKMLQEELANEQLPDKDLKRKRVVEMAQYHKNGSIVHTEETVSFLRDKDGMAIGIIGVTRDITERRKAELLLRQSEEKYSTLVEKAIECVTINRDEDKRIVFANKRMSEVSGYSIEELLEMTVLDLIPPDFFPVLQERFRLRMEGKEIPDILETRLLCKDGTVKELESSTRLIEYQGIPAVMSITRDFTERKRAEKALSESEERYRLLADNASDVIMLMDMNVKPIYFSPSVTRLLGYSVEEALTGTMEDRITPDSAEKAMKHFMVGLDREKREPGSSRGQTLELDMVHKNGSIVVVEMMVSFIRDASGKPTGMMGILRDITGRKKTEKEIVELSNAFRAALDPVLIFDMQGNLVNANDAARKMFESDEAGVNALEAVASEDRERVAAALQDLITNGRSSVVQFNIVTQSGRRVLIEASGNLMLDASGKPVGIVVVERDLTERKQAEDALRESEDKMRSLFEVSPDVIMNIDRQGKILFINRATTRTIEETIGTPVYDYIPSEYQSLYAKTVENVFRTGKPDKIETKGLGPGKRMHWYEARFVLLESGGEEKTLMVVATDITERKQAEEALKESEERFRKAFDSANTGMCLVGLTGNLIKVNARMCEIFGYSNEELERMTVNDITHPEDRDVSPEFMKKAVEGEVESSVFDKRYLSKRGVLVWGQVSSAIVRDADGNPLYFISQVQDVTERKRAQEALNASEEKYRTLIQNIRDAIFIIKDAKIRYANAGFAKIVDYSVEELIGKSIEELVAPEDLAMVSDHYVRRMKGEQVPSEYEFRLVKKDSVTRVDVSMSVGVITYEGGPAAMGIGKDITERKAKELEYRTILQTAIDGFWQADMKGRFLDVNEAYCRLMGYSRDELLNMSISDIEAIEKTEDIGKRIRKIKEVGYGHFESRHRCKDGKVVDVGISVNYLPTAGGRMFVFIRDITERKRAQETLLRVSKAVESSSDAIGLSDAQGHHFYHNKAFTDLFEYTPEELEAEGGGPAAFANRNAARKVFDTIMGGGSWSGEVEMVSKSGRKFTVMERADAIKDESGKVIGLVGVHTDITERKSAEDKLRETRDYMENLIEHANVPMVVWTPDFRITRFNRAFERLTGMKAKAVIGKNLEILFPEGTRVKSMSYVRTAVSGARWEVVEIPIVNVEGTVKTVLWNISTIYAEDRKTPIAIIAQGQDITERKQAEEALRESEEMSRSMLDNAAMGIYLLQNKKFLYVNPTFEKIIGYTGEELVGKESLNYVHPNDRSIVRIRAVENLKGVSTLPYEFRVLRKDGQQIWVMERVTSIRYKRKRAVIASFMETTEHRKAEEELERAYEELKTAHDRMVQSEKLRAMGEMASGIAHDFNNMLAVILGRTQLVIDDVKDDKVKKGIQVIEQAALDAAKTVKRLQDFARIRVEHPFESLDVNELVEGVFKMVEPRVIELEQTKGIAIKVEQELGKVGQVSGDAAELREALLNILFNAMDAMPTGGKLTVKSWQDEDWVQISVKDTGVGIPDKVKGRLFEPFFTTKASKGSGLGLSVTYGIIARHGGMLKFDSAVGKGTTFYIRLPLTVEAVKKKTKKGKAVASKPANILAVDDEPEVLQALGLTMENLGHWVKGVASGDEAIKAFKGGNYDLVITDLGMPGMSGWDVARAVKKMKPDMPVLMITGWVIDLDEEQKKLVDGVIAKPFSRDSITSAISRVFPARKKRTRKKKSE